MRIGIDAREIHGKPTGVGRYLNEILAAWKGMPEARPHEIVLFGETTGGSTLHQGSNTEPFASQTLAR